MPTAYALFTTGWRCGPLGVGIDRNYRARSMSRMLQSTRMPPLKAAYSTKKPRRSAFVAGLRAEKVDGTTMAPEAARAYAS